MDKDEIEEYKEQYKENMKSIKYKKRYKEIQIRNARLLMKYDD